MMAKTEKVRIRISGRETDKAKDASGRIPRKPDGPEAGTDSIVPWAAGSDSIIQDTAGTDSIVRETAGADSIVQETVGTCLRNGGIWNITYEETGPEGERTKVLVRLWESPRQRMEMIRRGASDTKMVFEEGFVWRGTYGTPYGTIPLEIITGQLQIKAEEAPANAPADLDGRMLTATAVYRIRLGADGSEEDSIPEDGASEREIRIEASGLRETDRSCDDRF